MKRLPPSIQEDHRYAAFRVDSEEPVLFGQVVDALQEAVLRVAGTSGASLADMWVMENRYSDEEQTGVVRFNSRTEDEIRSSIALIEDVGGNKASFEVLEVSGTLKSLEN
ncbi:MAG: Rpp14/Pop5 family protein [Candidatus Nanohaloarchaea archaeon]